jgi:DNA (cytosine-5)-methyltransferase 1
MSPVDYPLGARRTTRNRPSDGTLRRGWTTTVSLRGGVGSCAEALCGAQPPSWHGPRRPQLIQPDDGRARPLILDVLCGRGGASIGYHRAGFDVVGVDGPPRPHYPFQPVLRSVTHARLRHPDIAAVHVYPPRKLIAVWRDWLITSGLPYVIEAEAISADELRDPVLLCGAMFLRRRHSHQVFETSFPVIAPPHPTDWRAKTRPLRAWSGINAADEDARVTPESSREDPQESIVPVFTEYIGRRLMAHLRGGGAHSFQDAEEPS